VSTSDGPADMTVRGEWIDGQRIVGDRTIEMEQPCKGDWCAYAVGDQPVYPSRVDVLVVADASPSMMPLLEELQVGLKMYLDRLLDIAACTYVDYHIGVVGIAIDDPDLVGKLVGDPTFLAFEADEPRGHIGDDIWARFEQIDDTATTEAGLTNVQAALSEPLVSAHNAGFYRPDAKLFVLIFTDEGDSSTGDAAEYLEFLRSQYSDVVVSGVFPGARRTDEGSLEIICNEFNASVEQIERYMTAVEQTGGTYIPYCEFDSADISTLADSIFDLAREE
jgi:hypothetical protein